MNKPIQLLIDEIGNGKKLHLSAEVIECLIDPSKTVRYNQNRLFALECITVGNFLQARIFIERAWIISGFAEEILPAYINVHQELKDYSAIKMAYKRIGIKYANKGEVNKAISYFNLWQYAFATNEKTDSYSHDFDILYAMQRISSQFPIRSSTGVRSQQKIRVAHIIYSHAPALHKIDFAIAEFIDKSKFDLSFVITDRYEPGLHDFISDFEKFGCDVICSNESDPLSQAFAIADKIALFAPDIIYVSAAMADFWTYFILLLFPKTPKGALLGGPPPLYISPIFDFCITGGYHLTMESMIDCYFVNTELTLPVYQKNDRTKRKDLGIPDDAILIFSGGRSSKFQSQKYWVLVEEILTSNINSYIVIIGILREEIKTFIDVIPESIQARMRFLASTKDYQNIIAFADIAIDTYPQSGGLLIMETMALGVPIVTFQNDYLSLYDQTNNSLAMEYCGVPQLIAKHGDFEKFKKIVYNLINDENFRYEMAGICKRKAQIDHGEPKRMVRKYEAIYMRILNEKKQKQSISKSIPLMEKDIFQTLSVKILTVKFFLSLKARFLKKIGL